MRDPIHDLAEHVAGTRFDDIPADAVGAARTFVLDTLGVGVGGSTGPQARDLVAAMARLDAGREARVWGSGTRQSAPAAALCNAYQAHCQEYDCIHEAAVAHVMTIVLPVALAEAERAGPITGRRLIEVVVLGVDVAAGLGAAAASGLRFFRPATAGAFGGTAALGRLRGFDAARQVHAFSLAYAQLCGTMQAHTEGSGLLAMQMGFNARNATTACDLAEAGFTGPLNILTGDFGYFRLFEDGGDPAALLAGLGRDWRISQVSHKPWPSGRATHGILDGCLVLQRRHGIEPASIAAIRLRVPPLIDHLVGRQPREGMSINYARLCARYVLACALLGGGRIGAGDFTDAAYLRADRQALAGKVAIAVRDDTGPSALVPIDIEIELASGARHSCTVREVYGSPANPMPRAAQLEKFHANWADAAAPLAPGSAGALIEAVDALEDLPDIRALVDLTTPG